MFVLREWYEGNSVAIRPEEMMEGNLLGFEVYQSVGMQCKGYEQRAARKLTYS